MLTGVGLLLLAFSPWLIHDLGARLSFSATAGILLWFQNREIRRGWFRMALAIPLVATAFTAPFALPVFGRFPTAFLPANLLATPAVPLLSLLATLLIMLPSGVAEMLAPAALWMANGALQGVEELHALCPPLRMVAPTGTLMGVGLTLLLCCLLGMAGRVRVVLCCLLALAGSGCLLRMGQRRMEDTCIHALPGGDVVVMAQGKASVFEPNGPERSKAWKWKTRTVLERVSMEEPRSVNGDPEGRLMWSNVALLARSPQEGRVWLSSPRSRSESLGPHRLPRTPCP
jgi:predicted membrane metal-binding protein